MSCNGCRVLRKGCSENCILRPCLEWIESPQAQAHATVFVAKFFGRAGLMSFISSVPHKQRPALFQSLLFEACGRTVNPVNGAVGLLWTGNWHVCQAAVQTVLCGGSLCQMPESIVGEVVNLNDSYKREGINNIPHMLSLHNQDSNPIRQCNDESTRDPIGDLGLSLMPGSIKKNRCGTPSANSEESETTTCFESFGFKEPCGQRGEKETKLLNLFT